MDVDGITVGAVTEVLLASGWHEVEEGTFRVVSTTAPWLDNIEPAIPQGGEVAMFSFQDGSREVGAAPVIVKGPLSSVLAVKEVFD
ncbi:hypothetical protein [Actinoallomurus iriomotensis]|uniref:Uncharacterized protein n=1 Tax=Actinoallomurus iriomotensis TaxID=478107 RepID=A0A9W6VV53_9ACTN|nr:hypothetical protein [Actinoallomurus iriomotensis]GLY80859.1 hypothetical protein Airi01_091260 [Actinoallomurus iriomotensis]